MSPFPSPPIPKVIDLYHGNIVHDFAALKAHGIVGVIHKCTQGATIADPMYAARRKLASDAGLLWGAYAFNTGQDVPAQVTEFLAHAEPDEDTLMALDFEDNPHSQMTLNQCRAFLATADEKLGRALVLYSGNRIKDLLGAYRDVKLGARRLWLPQYGPVPHAQLSWGAAWLWQYSEVGRLPGTDGAIDLNAFAGSDADLKLEWAA